jgi:glycosyltransferase involved in cell wall biosynthesis
MTQVVIVQRRLPHYREPFFETLRDIARERGITLRLVHGNPTQREAAKNDSGRIAWADFVPCHYALGDRLCWQNVSSRLAGADLAIVTAENRLLYNHWLQLRGTSFRLAFWGHGANFQGRADTWREHFKATMARRVDWWFAYTDLSRQSLERLGYPPARITVVNNAVDTTDMQRLRREVTDDEIVALRRNQSIAGRRLGVFVGSLYTEKRIEFLLAAGQRVRKQLDDFELLIVGDGPDRALVESFAGRHRWCHYLGARTGRDKAVALCAAQVILNPGLVGLSILDSFAFGVPMVTTDCGLHSPEIAYLETGFNGLMTADCLEAYVDAVAEVLTDDQLRERLREACLRSAAHYTVEKMATRYVEGIEACLRAPRI